MIGIVNPIPLTVSVIFEKVFVLVSITLFAFTESCTDKQYHLHMELCITYY